MPTDPGTIRNEIINDIVKVVSAKQRHDILAARWEAVASWNRVVVTLTSSISAISVVGSNTAVATIFAIATAIIAAINAGFSPSDRAKVHRDASRSYGHIVRPLEALVGTIDSAMWKQDQRGKWRFIPRPDISDRKMRAIWDAYTNDGTQIEAADQSAPTVTRIWPRLPWRKLGRRARQSRGA